MKLVLMCAAVVPGLCLGQGTPMKMLAYEKNSATLIRPAWLVGKWTDVKANAVYQKLRQQVDQLPARRRTVTTPMVETWVNKAKSEFDGSKTWEKFFTWMYLCGRYPNVGRKHMLTIDRFLFQFQSPDSVEVARAGFIYVGNVHNDPFNLPSNFMGRIRSIWTRGDWLLTEAFVRTYAYSSKPRKGDLQWSYEEAKRLADTMQDGAYGFGRLRLEAAVPLITTSLQFLDQEVAYIDKLIQGRFFSSADNQKLANTKAFFLQVKKRIQDAKKGGGQGMPLAMKKARKSYLNEARRAGIKLD